MIHINSLARSIFPFIFQCKQKFLQEKKLMSLLCWFNIAFERLVRNYFWFFLMTFSSQRQYVFFQYVLSRFHTNCTKLYIMAKVPCSLRNKSNQNFLWICAFTQYLLCNIKFSRNSVELFSGVVLTNWFI